MTAPRRAGFRPSPGARLAGAIWLVVAVATAPLASAPAVGASAAVVVVCGVALKPRPRAVLSVFLPATVVIAAVCVPFAFQSFERAALLSLRAGLSAMVAAIFAATLRETELVAGLRTLRVPPVFTAIFATMLRQSRALGSEGRRLVLSRQLRGARGLGAAPDVMAHLLVRAVARAERTSLAMQLRGYGPDTYRAAPLQPADLPFSLVALALGLAPHFTAKLTAP